MSKMSGPAWTLSRGAVAADVACMARRARAELSRIFARIIQARRQSKAGEEDILQCFIDSRYEKVRGHLNP